MQPIKRFLLNFILSIYKRVGIVRLIFRQLRAAYFRHWLKALVRQRLAQGEPIRIVLGANKKFQKEWIPAEIYYLNILKPEDWKRYFPEESIDALLAEHVWEHLSRERGVFAAKMCLEYLKSGGYIRVAVPDGLFPDPRYIEWVRPGGTGPSAQCHRMLYTYKSLKEAFEEAGFRVELLEYFDERGEFHYKEWDPAQGMIIRSKRFYEGHTFGALKYTSIVLDAKK